MAKSVNDLVLDASLNYIKANANLMIVCSTQPTTRTEAVTTYALADVAMSTASDYAIADDTSGRKLTTVAKTAIFIDAGGSAQHIALVDATNLLYVTTCTTQALSSGNTVDVPAWKINLQDPT